MVSKANLYSSIEVYGCSFVAKLSWKKKYFFKIFVFFTKYALFAEKKCFYMEKKIFIAKNVNENVKKIYLISEIYFYTENVWVINKI